MHVANPAVVVREVVRCVPAGGLLTVFEPDWSTMKVKGSAVPPAWLSPAMHPAVGSGVGGLLAAAGCEVLDCVEERSWWDFAAFGRVTNPDQSLARAVARGAAPQDEVAWMAKQRQRAAAGDFRAEIGRVLWVTASRAEHIAPARFGTSRALGGGRCAEPRRLRYPPTVEAIDA